MSEIPHPTWIPTGPLPPGGVQVEAGETLDRFCGHFRIFQYAQGHRFGIDELLLAWFATCWCPRLHRCADLGSGIGSVALALAWRSPGATLHTVEAQAISVRLARKSVAYNGLEGRITVQQGDLRDGGLLTHGPFDLVTATPPYWPPGSQVEAHHPQAQAARLEMRGSIHDYAQAAASLLAPGGTFACVFPLDQSDRAEAAYAHAGLALLTVQDMHFQAGAPQGLRCFAGTRPAQGAEERRVPPGPAHRCEPLMLRREDHSLHPSMARVRMAMGFPPTLPLTTPVRLARRMGARRMGAPASAGPLPASE